MREISYRKLESTEAGEFRRVRLECLKNFPDNFGTLYEDEVVKPKLYFEEMIELDAADVFFYGAFDDDALIGIAGFVRGNRTKTRHRGEIVSMYVDPACRGRRVGEKMLGALLEAVFALEGIDSIELTVVADNAAATRLYEKLGFETYGIRKNYFKKGEKYWDQRFMALERHGFEDAAKVS